MVAWSGFLCSCTEEEERIGKAVLTSAGLPFLEAEAQEAARLFLKTGKSRSLRVDAMIAGTAVLRNARLATQNKQDFERFVTLGLRLVS